MKAFDIMVHDIISVSPDTSVDEAVKLLVEHDLSALPVVEKGELVGIISEADLIHRTEIGTETHRPWWLEAMTPASTLAAEFAKSHGKKVSELMSDVVVSASEGASLAEIATLLERYRIKRIPIVADGKLTGIVSRSNLIQAIASRIQSAGEDVDRDRQIRQELLARLGEQSWTHFGSRNVTVGGGTVHLWGLVGSKEERKALVALAEGVPGVDRVLDEMIAAYGEG
ncbi:MAG: CBS domain-containing protein [Bosea sp.]|uniref:CBS domain-containing protein n=1 Tax=Bosea sp. (in: a-proteobacteria) TaxID=1871050 RepID=UPI0023A23E70|nr:CBS domain-containing protein [Bosea sp. (in: a-proteobacteria)]MCP4737525.1 CBS domain-containing protein [Bosea sp. (in: a-proteobacteria)]